MKMILDRPRYADTYRRYRLDLKLQRKKNNARYFVLISKSVEGLQSILLFLTPKPVQPNHWN